MEQQSEQNLKIQAMISELEQQRNWAMTRVGIIAGEMEVLKQQLQIAVDKIKSLEEKPLEEDATIT